MGVEQVGMEETEEKDKEKVPIREEDTCRFCSKCV